MKQLTPYSVENGFSQTGSCMLSLYEAESSTMLPILIGPHEAQMLLIALRGTPTQRPMTHSLVLNLMEAFGLSVSHVSIDRMSEGIFYASLHVSDGFNTQVLDSRVTDAVTLALLSNAPIYAADSILEECGVHADLRPSAPTPDSRDELLRRLHECEAAENYEEAAEIQALLDQLADIRPTQNDTDL